METLLWLCLAAGTLAACGPAPQSKPDAGGEDAGVDAPPVCEQRCSADERQVLDCRGNVVETCAGTDACDAVSSTCINACAAAESSHRSIGCDYYAVHMDTYQPKYCFAMFVANTWTSPAKISVTYNGTPLTVESFTRLPVGSGPGLTYTPYNAASGLPPGEVAVLFLGGGNTTNTAAQCPVTAAVPTSSMIGTGINKAFHVTTDVPVVAYQISPYGGGSVAVTGASLLLPSSSWDTKYVAVNVSPAVDLSGKPSLNIIAREDGTTATIVPAANVVGGGGIPAGLAGQPLTLTLSKGQHAQITQDTELTGSVITANKPIGFMAGQTCMNMPTTASFCDHGEQMIPPTRALGHRYVGVMYRPRVASETATFWRLVGAVDDTQLTWSTSISGAPASLRKGESVTFQTGTPFFVSSQDKDHPFMLFTYMTGSSFVSDGYGDPDFVLSVPPEQYLKQYVFFADPTYPETNLVLVRTRGADQQFHDVTLDCLGKVTGWQAVNGSYEYARVDLMTGNFTAVGTCSTGRHEISSDAPFGLWVWGWGTPLTGTTPFTKYVSYGYPGGMNVSPINDVIIN